MSKGAYWTALVILNLLACTALFFPVGLYLGTNEDWDASTSTLWNALGFFGVRALFLGGIPAIVPALCAAFLAASARDNANKDRLHKWKVMLYEWLFLVGWSMVIPLLPDHLARFILRLYGAEA